MIRSSLFFVLTILSFYSFSQGGVACAEMAPICTDVGLNFTANAGIDQAGTTDPGNDYDCLISQPNPTWYYFQIATDGDIIMELSADQDIDYAIWGPFSTLSVAQSACNSMGDQSPPNPDNGNIVDCSFSPTEVETPIITGAITGEVYVMLITNYAGVVQDIALSQTGGSGSTDCNIVTNPPCSISAFNANPSGCDFTTNTYSVSGVIEYTSAPTAGSLVVEDCNGNTTVVDNFPFAASPQNFSLTGLVSDGLPCDVEVYFTADPTCSQQYNYTAPVCVNNCPAYDLFASSPPEACGNQQYFLEIQNSACDGTVNFEVSGDYGTFPSEISWYVTSNLTGNQVASGSGGAAGGTFNVAVGPIDPNIEGTIFNLVVEDSWGDGFSGGGFIQTEAPDGTVLGGPITGNFGVFSNSYFNSGIIVSSSTITVTTPTGAVTSVVGNCGDHSIPITLQNNNYCTPIVVDLPWMIMCDLTGTLIASGTHSVTVYPQVPTNASDLVSIDWNASTCSWDVTPQNDCDVLDLNVLYSISPDPSSLAAGCSNGTEEFTVTYLGFAEGPDCCSTGGPLIPATYTNNQGTTDFITQTAYGGTNNAAYGTVPGSGIGGNSTAVTIDISGSGYCFPNVPSPPGPPVTGEDDYYVDIYVDGVQIAIYGPLSDPPGSFNYTFTHADLLAAGVTYNQNSVIEVYVLPNQFYDPGPPQINTVYIPGANCNTLAAGEWSASSFSIDVAATYEQFVASPANCTFIVNEPFTCCSTGALSATAPSNQNVECIDDVPPIDITLVTNIISDCPTTVAFVSDVSDGASCPEVITRTYSVTDDCGNSTTVTQTITVNDITAPTASNPTDIVIPIGPAPAPDINQVLDEADNCTVSPVVAFVSDVSDGVECPETITRTYSVTDDCGNQILVTQTIVIGGGNVPEPTVSANGPICEGEDAIFTIEGIIDAVVTYDVGLGSQTTVLTGGISIITVPSAAPPNSTITLSNISDESCSSVLNLTATTIVNPPALPSFVQLGSYCEGETPGILNTTSIEGITGTWSPTAITTAVPGTSTYTFSEDVGQCAIGTTMNVTVTSPAPPTFTQIEPICINGVAPALLGTSDNGVAGTWNPSVINTAIAGTNTYTFTPEAGLCAISATMDIVIEPAVQSSFTQLGTYCEGETPDILNTTSIEGITGTWSPTAINTAAPGTSAYTFSIDVGQCALGTSMNISISAPIVTAFTQVDPICINGTAPILSGTSDNGITGSWTPSTVNTATIGTGIYTFTPDPGICATSASMDIVIDPATQASFTQLGPYCQGETSGVLTNTSIEGITGTWSPTAITTAIPGTSTYTFSEDLGQCAIGATMNVTITPPETPTFTQIAPICINGGAPALPGTSDNGFTGTWTPSTINTATAGISTYTFTPDAGLCTISATMDITIVELPFVDPGADQIISCITNVGGAQIGSPAVPGNTYSWSPSADLTDANNSNPIANPIGTTTYTVTVTNSSGCISAGQVNVSIDNAPPTIAITNNTATNILTCTVLALNVTASGGLNYSWDSGLGNDAAATITAPGIYTVTGTAPNGCQETESIEVTQDNNIDLFVTLSEPEICSGEEITLTMNSTIATDFDWTVIQNGVTGASAGALPNSGVGAEITQTLQLTSSNNGEVEYIITPTSGGCIGESQSVTVYLLAPIEPQFDALGPFCINETPTSLQMVSNEGVSGTWNPSTISTTLAGTSNYIFTPNPDQCALTQNMDILINELPLVSFSADNLVGCAPHVVNLTSTNASGTWTVGNGVVLEGTQAQLTLFNPGCYDVTLEIEQDGCSNSLTTENYLCVEEAPVADFTATPDVFTDQDVLVSFTNLSIGASSFIWDFGDQNTSTYINPSNLYESTEEGALITLIAVSDFGCTDEAQLIIEYEEQEVFYVPNTFTPDGDNFNQMFTPVFYSGFDPYNFEMLIYNRWGELVFESKNADIGWDGTYGLSGMKASDGAYTWKITYKNPKTDQRKVIVGHVTLIR